MRQPLAVAELALGVAGLPKRLHPLPADSGACGELPKRRQPGLVAAAAACAAGALGALDRTVGTMLGARLEFPMATLPCCRLICDRLCCCCANGTRLADAGELRRLLLNAVARTGEVTGRSENRKLEDEGVIGTCPLTRLAC